jgi:uncharacterized protein (TIGR00725 family)
MPHVVAVIGRGDCSDVEEAVAEEVGGRLAEWGAVLICGGLGGVMKAACRGARGKGGFTVGILPGNDRHSANEWVSLPIAAGTGQARNLAVVRSADAVIAVGGAFGTLSEIAFALDAGIPVVGIGSWRLARNGAESSPVIEAASAEEAVDTVRRLVAERSTSQ